MSRKHLKLIGVDLDGVIALENSAAYFAAKEAGISALRNYFKTLVPNELFITQLQLNWHKYRYKIYTARRNDLPDIESITYEWLAEHNLMPLFEGIVFTGNHWKWPWLIKDWVFAHIDNDATHLRWYPWMWRILYNPFTQDRFYNKYKPLWDEFHLECSLKLPKYIFDFLDKV